MMTMIERTLSNCDLERKEVIKFNRRIITYIREKLNQREANKQL
jgi:hypothetical protein